MQKLTAQDRLLVAIRQLLPDMVRTDETLNTEVVQTTVWLVGLATGFLGVLAAKPDILIRLGYTRMLLIPGLVAVAVLGLLQRLVLQTGVRKERALAFRVQMALWGRTEIFDDPQPLEDWWTAEEILERLRQHFGERDYEILAHNQAPIESYREAYRSEYGVWEQHESRKAEHTRQFIAAVEGKTAPAKEETDSAQNQNYLDAIRKQARSVIRWHRASTILYLVTGAVFVSSAAALAASLFK